MRGLLNVVLLAVLLVLIGPVTPAFAGELVGDEFYVLNDQLIIEGNLHVVAGAVSIDGTVNGDAVIVTTGSVTINGLVTGDVTVFGGRLVVHGQVDGDVRGVVTSVVLGDEATIGGDVLLSTSRVFNSGTISGDLQVAAKSVTTTGALGGNLDAVATTLLVDGYVGGSVHTHIADVVVGPDAHIDGDVVATKDLSVSEEAFVQGSSRSIGDRGVPLQVRAALLLAALVWALILMLLGPTVAWLGGDWLKERTMQTSRSLLVTGLRGLSIWISPIAVSAALLILAIGLPLSARPIVLLTALAVFVGGVAVVGVASVIGFVPVLASVGSKAFGGRRSFYASYVITVVALIISLQIPWLQLAVLPLILILGAGAVFQRKKTPPDLTWFLHRS